MGFCWGPIKGYTTNLVQGLYLRRGVLRTIARSRKMVGVKIRLLWVLSPRLGFRDGAAKGQGT